MRRNPWQTPAGSETETRQKFTHRQAFATGFLRITQLQKPGGKRLPVREFLTGFGLAAGQRFQPASAQ